MPMTLAPAASTASTSRASSARSIGWRTLLSFKRLVGDADNGDVRVLARQLIGEIGRAHVAQHVLEPQQARRVARHDLREQQRGEHGKDRAQEKRARKQRAGPQAAPGIVDHRKRPIVPACTTLLERGASETSASIHALPGRTAGM